MALDFPSNPVDGQVYGNFYWDASMSAWRSSGTGMPNSFSNAIATSSNATSVPLTVKGSTSQSANLQNWVNSSGTTLSSISSAGSLSLATPLAISSGGTGVLTGAGLTPIVPTSVTMSTGTATIGTTGAITYSGGTTLTIYGVFSSTYRNYKIVAQTATAANPAEWQGIQYVKTSDSTVNSAANYQSYYNESNDASGFNTREIQTAATYAKVWPSGNYLGNASLDIYQPYQSIFTVALGQTFYTSASNTTMGVIQHSSKENISYSGFRIYSTSSSNMSGVIQIYGYN